MALKDIEYHIAKLNLGSEDILVIKVKSPSTAAFLSNVKDYINRHIKIPNKILVMDDRMDISVLTRAELEAKL